MSYTVEQLEQYKAQMRAAVPALDAVETTIALAQVKFQQAEGLRNKMRKQDSEADRLREEIAAFSRTIKNAEDFYAQREQVIEDNEAQLKVAFAEDLELARKNKSDGSIFIGIMRQIKDIARMDLQDLTDDEKMKAHRALDEIGDRTKLLKEKSAKVNALAAEAYKVHAEGLAILKEAGLPADICKKKVERTEEIEE